MNEKREITGVRSAPTYKTSPFLSGTGPVVQVRGRRKNYSVASGMSLVDEGGAVRGSVQHTISRVVDDAQFVKVFSDGIAALYDLGKSGGKVFRYLFDEVQKSPNQDRIYLYFMDALEEPWAIPKTSFFKGLAELLDKNFLAKSANPNMFFLNPAMIWNGDRFRFIQDYQRASAVAARSDQNLLEAAGQLRITELESV